MFNMPEESKEAGNLALLSSVLLNAPARNVSVVLKISFVPKRRSETVAAFSKQGGVVGMPPDGVFRFISWFLHGPYVMVMYYREDGRDEVERSKKALDQLASAVHTFMRLLRGL